MSIGQIFSTQYSAKSWRFYTASYGWLFTLPALVGILLFVCLPFLLAFAFAFTNYKMGSPIPFSWIGFEQFKRIFTDPSFVQALVNNTLYAVFIVPIQTTAALALAILLNQKMRAVSAVRALFFAPVVFPMSLVAVVWILFFAPSDLGLFNALLKTITLGHWESIDFLRTPGYAFAAVVTTSIWQGVGFQMIIILAGLQAVPRYLYEAATLDGATTWQQFCYVTLPQIKLTLLFVALVTTILAFRLFDQVRIMTSGGPHDTTTTVILEAVNSAFDQQKVAQASAMTVIFFLAVLIISICQSKLLGRK